MLVRTAGKEFPRQYLPKRFFWSCGPKVCVTDYQFIYCLCFFLAEKSFNPKSEAYQKIPLIVSSDCLEVYLTIGKANDYIPPPRKHKRLAKLQKDNKQTIKEVKKCLINDNDNDGDSVAGYKIVPHDSQAVGNVLYHCVDDEEYPAIAMINNSHIQNTQKSTSNVKVCFFLLV